VQAQIIARCLASGERIIASPMAKFLRVAGFGLALLGVAPSAAAQSFGPTTSLPEPYWLHQMVAVENSLIHLGGLSGVNGVGNAHRTFAAPILPGGSLGLWAPGPDLPTAVFQHTAIAHNQFVYVISGRHFDATEGLRSEPNVYFAAAGADGLLGAWQETTPLPVGVFFASASFSRGRIYVSGGHDDSTLQTSVYSAATQADGTLGTWRSEAPLPVATYTHETVAVGDSLFLLGGLADNGETVTDAVYRSHIGSDGVLGDWMPAAALSQPVSSHTLFASEGRVHVVGGFYEQPRHEVLASDISEDGSFGEWVTLERLPFPRYAHATTTANGYAYVSGGINNSVELDVWYAALPSAVPEPGTYALLLAGLGLLGFISRPRRSSLNAAA
jgi:hypothetical protein